MVLSTKELAMITSLFNQDFFADESKVRVYCGRDDGGDDHFIENITPADWHLLWDTMMSFTDESWKADQDRKLEITKRGA